MADSKFWDFKFQNGAFMTQNGGFKIPKIQNGGFKISKIQNGGFKISKTQNGGFKICNAWLNSTLSKDFMITHLNFLDKWIKINDFFQKPTKNLQNCSIKFQE